MSNGAEDQSLMERVEFPTIPVEAQKKIAHLQEEFMRAEVQQCKSLCFCFAAAFYATYRCLRKIFFPHSLSLQWRLKIFVIMSFEA